MGNYRLVLFMKIKAWLIILLYDVCHTPYLTFMTVTRGFMLI
ncbi:hypothetical protein J2T13_002630 [Paenibacillus sp. DS2015]